jgi:hypothetical protein
MKKKIFLTVIAFGVFFIASCDNLQNVLDDSLSNLGFLPESLKEGAAKKGVKAGSFSVEGGDGSLSFSLISSSGEHNDNDKFTLEGSLLNINAPSLEAKSYYLYVRVEDSKGKFLEGSFALKVNPPDGNGEPETDSPGTGALKTEQVDDAGLSGILEPWRGIWYSLYSGSRLDSYRIGRWSEIKEVMEGKLALFPKFDPDNPRLHDNYLIQDGDYFIFYDDSVYGQDENGEGGNGGWDGFITRYIGIVRAVNIFNGDSSTGAVVIEYLEGCYPQWAMDVIYWPLPFFGIYYRVTGPDSIRMANAVDLDALFAGKAYYTETATLQEAINKNNAKNSDNFISWGVVYPQNRSN